MILSKIFTRVNKKIFIKRFCSQKDFEKPKENLEKMDNLQDPKLDQKII